MTPSPASTRVAVLGGGSAAEQLCRSLEQLSSGDISVTVYEPGLVGGECPFVACMPSKAMLHVARTGGTWSEAIEHRDDVIEQAERSFEQHPPAVTAVVTESLAERGVRFHHGVEATAVRASDDAVTVELADGATVEAERVLVAVGRRPRTGGLGLDSIGIDEHAPLPVDGRGKLDSAGSIWAIGDVAGRGEYTHLANHQATVVAEHLSGSDDRRFDDVAVAGCMFTDPPLMFVGETWASLRDGAEDDGAGRSVAGRSVAGGQNAEIVTAELDLTDLPRALTDNVQRGHLWVAARRSTGAPIAAAGAGAGLDELVHALVIAVDQQLPVAQLRRSLRPFPTMGEALGVVWDRLHEQLDTP